MSAALPLAEALDRLRDPASPEIWSPLGPETVLVVDVSGDAPDLSSAERLRRLHVPSVALEADRASPSGAALLDAFDVHVAGDCDPAPVLEATRTSPQASAALVQLLRQGTHLDLQQALVAESLAYSTLQSGPEFAAWLADRPPPKAPAANPEPAVEALRDGDVLRIRLNRPERRNAYSAEMRDALCESLAAAAADPAVRVVLEGAGPCFSSGGDLFEFGTLPDPATAHAIRTGRSAARLLAEIAPRVEARVHGPCVGAGSELPAFAGRVVARPDATFQLPEIRMGLIPGAGGTASLPRRIGRQRTAWLALSAQPLDAPSAREWGLVDAIAA